MSDDSKVIWNESMDFNTFGWSKSNFKWKYGLWWSPSFDDVKVILHVNMGFNNSKVYDLQWPCFTLKSLVMLLTNCTPLEFFRFLGHNPDFCRFLFSSSYFVFHKIANKVPSALGCSSKWRIPFCEPAFEVLSSLCMRSPNTNVQIFWAHTDH